MNGRMHGAQENARLNKIENMEVKLGDAILLGNEKVRYYFCKHSQKCID
jgi:hypothetical protein